VRARRKRSCLRTVVRQCIFARDDRWKVDKACVSERVIGRASPVASGWVMETGIRFAGIARREAIRSLLLSHPPAPCNSSSTTSLSHQLLNRAWGNSCPGPGDPADGARHSFPMHGRTRNMEFHRQLRKISTENVWSSEMVFLSALRGTVAQLVFNQRA
jgi:hypothetical protein